MVEGQGVGGGGGVGRVVSPFLFFFLFFFSLTLEYLTPCLRRFGGCFLGGECWLTFYYEQGTEQEGETDDEGAGLA